MARFKVQVQKSYLTVETGYAIVEADSEETLRNNHITTCGLVEKFENPKSFDYSYQIEDIMELDD